MANAWMIRAGRKARYVDQFLEEGCVWISIAEGLPAVSPSIDKAELIKRIRAVEPEWREGSVAASASTAVRYFQTVTEGDQVVTYSPADRRYYLGTIAGMAPPREAEDDVYYVRPVKWTHRVLRDSLSQQAKNSLGSIATLFEVKKPTLQELESHAVPIDAPETADSGVAPRAERKKKQDGEERASYDEVVERSEELISDMIATLDPDQMEDLVAGILRGMGYRARRTAKGADRGVDVFASPDGLGLEEPRIFVEVKHRLGTKIGSQVIRAFMGGRQQGDRCLFVSTGGFAKDARYEAERSAVPLTLIDMPTLRDLVLERYDALDEETKRLVPLTRLWWPTPKVG